MLETAEAFSTPDTLYEVQKKDEDWDRLVTGVTYNKRTYPRYSATSSKKGMSTIGKW
jgi:hypothetical protein